VTAVRVVVGLFDSTGSPIQGRAVYFYASGDGSVWTLIGEDTTDSGGYASVVYNVSGKTWFKAEFMGDDEYEPASAVVVWEPSGCEPVVRTGVDVLDRVLFCVGGYGVTVSVVVVVSLILLLLFGRRR
jgi:hypothetical protein